MNQRKSVWAPVALVVVLAAATNVAGQAPKADAADPRVERGRYLVNTSGCNDCHTPWHVGPDGPEPDWSRLLSGHPQQMELPPPPAPVGPWIASVAATNTAWAGPWGISFTANLTPDAETGLGRWSEQEFVDTLRSGRHLGRGRAILPPMPWTVYGQMTDEDLAAVFAYLKSLPPIQNKVPDPVPPPPAR